MEQSNCKAPPPCELCNGVAAVYCSADEAFVCWECDAKVHGANFIVARHSRLILCERCQAPGMSLLDSADAAAFCKLCPACSASSSSISSGSDDSLMSSSTSDGSEHSSTETGVQRIPRSRRSCKRRPRSPASVLQARDRHFRRRLNKVAILNKDKLNKDKLGSVFRRWSLQLGLSASIAARIVPLAMHFLRKCREQQVEHKLDARATLAACLWVAIRVEFCTLPPASVERCTGVPAGLLVATEARLFCMNNKTFF